MNKVKVQFAWKFGQITSLKIDHLHYVIEKTLSRLYHLIVSLLRNKAWSLLANLLTLQYALVIQTKSLGEDLEVRHENAVSTMCQTQAMTTERVKST